MRKFAEKITHLSYTKLIPFGFLVSNQLKNPYIIRLVMIKTRPLRYQDVHNQAYIMVMASGRWLGARLDCLASLLVGAVAVAAILVSQDAGKLKILSNDFESLYVK